jgi:hypothetical protein
VNRIRLRLKMRKTNKANLNDFWKIFIKISSSIIDKCRVRSPNAPIKGVIGDHALQNKSASTMRSSPSLAFFPPQALQAEIILPS